MRLNIIFVAVCMVLIAGSAGGLAYAAFGFGMAAATLTAVTVLTVLSLYHAVSARLGVRILVGSQLSDLSHGNADMARQVARLEHDLATLERRIDGAIERTRAVTDPLAVELGELRSLVRQLAETLTAQETRLTQIARASATAKTSTAPPAEPQPAPVPAVSTSAPVAAGPPAKAATAEAMAATISAAVEANRIDLYLQPMVTLPQRKVRYYEALSRLRTDRGEVIPAADFLASAEAHGLMPKIDNLVIFRCVQVVRRLLIKNPEIGLFCNLSGATLTDGAVFPQLLEFLDANRAIAPSIVLEFCQRALRAAGSIENESLAALADRGFRFSLDNMTDLRLEPRDLATRGFRFIKVRADILLHRTAAAGDIHPADLADLLRHFGIDLIAEKIESEGAVVDLLDYHVRFGQGFLFSPPRPVRAEALQSSVARGELAAHEPKAPAETPPAASQAPGEVTAAAAAALRPSARSPAAFDEATPIV